MNVFGNYSRYYDLLYKDKDYNGETAYVDKLLQRYGNAPGSILELGCGTGKHALLLSQKGYTVTGIDQSEEMLKKACARKNEYPDVKCEFYTGDVRNVRLDKQFDAVISLFHVISYQTSNEDLLDAFKTAAVHLKSGGTFIFDFWYGPAVLTDRPVVRVKKLEDECIKVTRIAEPVMHYNECIVDVNYTVTIKEKETADTDELTETHRMRYLFLPEVALFLKQAGLHLEHAEEWVSGNIPGAGTWGVVVIATSDKKKFC